MSDKDKPDIVSKIDLLEETADQSILTNINVVEKREDYRTLKQKSDDVREKRRYQILSIRMLITAIVILSLTGTAVYIFLATLSGCNGGKCSELHLKWAESALTALLGFAAGAFWRDDRGSS